MDFVRRMSLVLRVNVWGGKRRECIKVVQAALLALCLGSCVMENAVAAGASPIPNDLPVPVSSSTIGASSQPVRNDRAAQMTSRLAAAGATSTCYGAPYQDKVGPR